MGHMVATPHPDAPVTDRTFVSVAIADREVDWGAGRGSGVRLVMLVCIERDNPVAYSLWHSLSGLVSNRRYVERIVAEPTYENFLEVIADSYRDA